MNIFMIAGEASGDSIGAALINAFKSKSKNMTYTGIGGPLMEKAGMNVLLPMDELSVMGIVEIITRLPQLMKLQKGIIQEIEARQPDIVVTIDFPDFNFNLAQKLKKRRKYKGKIVHYVAPTVWAWRPGRAKAVSKYLDGLICLFPFEPALFKVHNLNAVYIGHPCTETLQEDIEGRKFRDLYEIPHDQKTLGLLFGSRASEFDGLAETIKEAALYLHERYPGMAFIVPTLPHMEFEVRKLVEDMPGPTYVFTDQLQKWDGFAACDAAIAVSGTVGLELAYADVPHVIGYKTNPVSWFLIRMLVKTKFAHLANIMLKKAVVPEFIQDQCTSKNISKAVRSLYEDVKATSKQRRAFAKLRSEMTKGLEISPSEKAAAFIAKVAKAK